MTESPGSRGSVGTGYPPLTISATGGTWPNASRSSAGQTPERFDVCVDAPSLVPSAWARDLIAGRVQADPHEAELLAGYLVANGPHLHTHRRMGPGHWLHGSGPVEKHVELQVGRRFKRRGMRWSRPGARHLLAIRTQVVSNR